MVSKSNKFLLFGMVFFILTSLLSSFISSSNIDNYSENFLNSFGDTPDPLSTSTDYFNGYLKYKEAFIPVPIKSKTKALSFIENLVKEADTEATAKAFVRESRKSIMSSRSTSDIYLSDSTYLSNGSMSFCLINLRDNFSYSGLKAIALEHEMAHCYLEERKIKSVFKDLLPIKSQKRARSILTSKVGRKNLKKTFFSYNYFLTESYADALSIYKPGGGSRFLSMVIKDRTDSFNSRKDEKYATQIFLQNVDFDYKDIDAFEDHVIRELSSEETLRQFLKLI